MNIIKLVTICTMILLMVLIGCRNADDGNTFVATVLENNESDILVEPVEGSAELGSADRIVVYIKDATLVDAQDKEITISDIGVGKQVEISYNGGIAESYPAQIQGCYRVKLLN